MSPIVQIICYLQLQLTLYSAVIVNYWKQYSIPILEKRHIIPWN